MAMGISQDHVELKTKQRGCSPRPPRRRGRLQLPPGQFQLRFSVLQKIFERLVPAIKCSQACQRKTKKYSEQQAAESMFMLVIPVRQINEEQILVSTVYGNNGSNHYNRKPHMATYIFQWIRQAFLGNN
jgi:hypothetical protein